MQERLSFTAEQRVQLPPHHRGAILPGTLLLSLLIGMALARLLLPGVPDGNSVEVRFARSMSIHHGQAVEMALALYSRTTDPNIRPLALDIILTQQNQIGQMQGWLASWNQPLVAQVAGPEQRSMMHGMASQQEVNALQTLPIAQAEISFLQLMIRHHHGGVMMAEQVLQESHRPEVVRLATAIVQSQQSEIQAMEQLLRLRGASSS